MAMAYQRFLHAWKNVMLLTVANNMAVFYSKHVNFSLPMPWRHI